MEELDILIEYVESDIQALENPGTYEPDEYYIRCKAKAEYAQNILIELKSIKRKMEEA